MRRTIGILAVALALLAGPVLAQSPTSNAWKPGSYTLVQALEAGFTVIDTYHSNEGRLFFVLQRQATLLLCMFEEVQADRCLQLGDD